MYHPARKREAMGDDPPFLTMGTEVSAKYKGAFCEAKVRKVVRSVKCRVTFKLGLGTAVVTDDQIKGVLRAGANVEVKHPDKKEFVEATITKIQDCSQYTVVFDDGDITTLRRTALCLKSGRHFAESETLDQLPLTHPEHFSNPVIGGRRGRRNRHAQDESSDEEEVPKKDKKKSEKEADIGKVVCVELGDKKKQKDNWFPGLVVAPTAQDTVRIRVKDDYLVRSFKDGRYYTVPKKEATAFTREIGSKVDNNTLKTAVEKALLFLDKDELPPHWDRELLFSVGDNSESDLDAESDIESSDDERQEEKDHFVAQLYKFMDDCGTPINKGPTIFDEDLDLYRLFKVVHKLGGYNRVTNHNQWKFVTSKLGLKSLTQTTANHVKQSYKKYLHNFEDFYRKLGCTMVNHPRGSRARHRSGRSLIRDRDRATPVSTTKISDKEKPSTSTASTAGPSVVPAKKAEPEEDKKKPAAKAKDEKPKVKEEKKETAVASTSSAAPAAAPVEDTKPRREIKVRSERLKMKVEKLKTWREESQSEEEEEASSTSGGSQPVTVEPSAGSPETDSNNEEQEEDDDDEEEEKPAGKPLERERRKPPTERKADEEEKTLRLRSKGGRSTPERARTRDARTPMRELEKKQAGTRSKTAREEESSNNPNPPHPPPQQPKKRGRKRKDSEKSRTGEEAGRLPPDVQVQLGDKLKVYYGQETKTTYEAKVIEIEEESSPNMFLVHYTGWNTRYDEWIPRTRIEENLSWTPARAKRSKLQQQQQQQQLQSTSSQPQGTQVLKSGRGRPVAGRGQEGAPPVHSTRSTTPSSVTSSSSRTKSPAQSSHNTRAQRAASRSEQTQSSSQQGTSSGIEFRRRPRRISGHADFLINVTESESESSESETEIEPMGLRRRRTRQDSESSARVEAPESRRPERLKRQPVRKDRSEEEEEETEERDVGDSDSQSQTRSRRGRRTRRVTESERKEEEQRQQQEQQPPTKVEEDQPKGRDFDLNQIRSELKGFDKAVKSPIEIVPSDTDTDIPVATAVKPEPAAVEDVPSTSTETVDKKEEISSTPSKKAAAVAAATPDLKKDDTDDIYEFKEPEPFEFEVRSKRDSTLAEERSKLSKRPIRLFDDLPEAKTPPKKKSPKKDTKAVKVEETTPESDTRRRRRFPLRKQDDDDDDSESSKPSTSKESPSPSGKAQQKSDSSSDSFKKLYDSTVFDKAKPESQQQKSDALTASEEVFKKIYASTTFPVLEAPARRSPRPLDLFADLPAGPDDDGDEGDDEGEDRLIISEPDTEPLFSYPQRHEEMLPTPTSRVSPEPGKSLFDFSGAGSSGSSSAKKSEVAKLMVHKAEGEEGTLTHVERPVPMHDDVIKLLLKEDEDDEEDSINAAIQRVISQSIHDDDDIDLLTKVMPELEPKSKASPKLTASTPPTKSVISPKPTPKLVPMSDTPKVQTPKVETTTSKQASSKVTTPEVKTKTPESTKVVPKVAEETSKATPKPSAESAIKTTSKPMPSLESITKIPPKSPLSAESPVKAMPKLVQTPEVTVKNTPKPALTADFTNKFATTYAKTPQATPESLAKPSGSKVIQSPEQTPGKLATRNSPSMEKSSLKPSEAAKVTPKSFSQTESPSTSQSDAAEKVGAKITSPQEPFVKSSAKVTPETYKFGSKLASALDPKSTPKSSTVSDMSKSLPITPKSSVIPLKTSASIAKSTLAAADSAMGKLSGKSAHSVEVPSKASPKSSLPEVSKTPASKSTPSTPEVFSRTKSPPVAESSKVKTTPEITPSKSGPSKPSESISKPPSAKVTPQFPLKESLKREAKKEPRKKALKKTVSKEFVEDTSSDSDSDTGMKLVIDKLEEDSISDSIGSDRKEDSRKESMGKTGFPKKTESEPRSILEKKLEACASEMEQRKRKKEDTEPTSSKKSKTEATKNIQEEEEADSSLNSLLCEETIPGSPPPVEAPQPVCPDTPKVREIPFASMPAGGNGASTSASPQQPPKPFSLRDEKPETSAASRTPAAGAAAQPPQPAAAAAAAAAAPAAAGSRKEDEAAPVMDNTPPTTPDSSISTISGSPREDRAGSSPHRDESGKSVRDSSEVDLDSPADANKGDPFSEDSLLNVEVSSSCEATSTLRPKTTPKRSEQEKEPMESPKKRRRTTNKKEDTPLLKRTRHSSGRSPRNIGAGSDSDDNSENSNPVNMSSLTSTDNLLANRSPRPSKYNFYVELDPELDGSQRIALLQHKLQELRKTYLEVKAELACIDRRRKKLRRREREANKAAAAAKQEVWCA